MKLSKAVLLTGLVLIVLGAGVFLAYRFAFDKHEPLPDNSFTPTPPQTENMPDATSTKSSVAHNKLSIPPLHEVEAVYNKMLVSMAEMPSPIPEAQAAKLADWRARLNVVLVDHRMEAARISLHARLDYLEHLASAGYLDDIDEKFFLMLMEEFESGKDPFDSIRGAYLRGYLSPVDETIQTYSINVPVGYDHKTPMPLVISLHHHGWSDWFRPYQGHPAPSIDGAIVLSPHGRGSADYMWVALEEVLASLEDVKKLYSVDEDRVYVTGYSMGGTGSWYAASRVPHLFAAISPVAGNADFTAWVKRWDWRLHSESPYAFLRQYLRESTCSAAYAENLRNIGVLCFHGSKDDIVPVEHARGMVDRLKQLGYERVKYVESDAGHMGKSLDEITSWMLTQKRDLYPAKVSLKTSSLRYNTAYYVSILEREEMDRYSQIELAWGDKVEITTENASMFAIEISNDLLNARGWSGQKEIEVDGKVVASIAAPNYDSLIVFVKSEDKWQLDIKSRNEQVNATGRKRPGLDGPIEDAFMRPFLVVYSTGDEDAELSTASKEEADRFVRNWRTRYVKPCHIKADKDVTERDIERYNLILYGSPWVNSVYARIAADLPITVSKDGIVLKRADEDVKFATNGVGTRFVCANPINLYRYVVINASTTSEGLEGIDFRFGNWFDWIPYDNRAWYDYCIFDAKTISPETFLIAGYFNNDWKFDARWAWVGIESDRNSVLPRSYPKSVLPPERPIVYLDEFRPIFTSTLKGFYNINRSWSGERLSAFGRPFNRGIGTRISSDLIWYVGGNYTRLKAQAGIDYGSQGVDTVSAARRSAEIVSLFVIGDGRILKKYSYLDSTTTKPIEIDVNISGITYLCLSARRQTPEGWLYGSVTWGDAAVYEE